MHKAGSLCKQTSKVWGYHAASSESGQQETTVWACPAACAHLSLFFTLFPPLLPDLLLLLSSEHEGHGRGGGLSHWGVKRHRMLRIYGDLVLIDVPAEYKGTSETSQPSEWMQLTIQLCMPWHIETAPRPNRNQCLHGQAFLAAKRMRQNARRLKVAQQEWTMCFVTAWYAYAPDGL